MRSFVPAIYDVTVSIPTRQPAPTMLRIFKRQPSVVRNIELIVFSFDQKFNEQKSEAHHQKIRG